jgi:hypothetical protein
LPHSVLVIEGPSTGPANNKEGSQIQLKRRLIGELISAGASQTYPTTAFPFSHSTCKKIRRLKYYASEFFFVAHTYIKFWGFTQYNLCRMAENTSINLTVLSSMWIYDVLNSVVAAMPPSLSTGWTISPLMSLVYKALLTLVRSHHLECTRYTQHLNAHSPSSL